MALFSSILAGRSQTPFATINVAGGVTVALSVDQAVPDTLIFTGTLTANIVVTLPALSGDAGAYWFVYNNTSGAFTLSVQAASGGATVAVTQAKRMLIYWDGTDMKAGITDVVRMGAAASGANADITALSGITGGITGTGTFAFDKIQGNGAPLAVGRLVKNLVGPTVLSAGEAANLWIEFTGTPGATSVTFPNSTTGAPWIVYNNAGALLTLQVAGQASPPTLASGKRNLYGFDGTNLLALLTATP